MSEAPLDKLDSQLQKAVSSGEIPGLSYAILKDGKVVRASTFGVADVETRRPWRFNTLCRVYSMTKSVAVCGLMRLVEDGHVSLSDPVSKFIPAFAQSRMQVVPDDSVVLAEPHHPRPRCEVAVKHLLTHCSGLSQGADLGESPGCATEEAYHSLIQRVDSGEIADLEQWCDELAKLPLRFQPGERWEYSYGIDLMGRIVEVVSGKKLDEFLREQVLAPLGMHDTAFALPEAKRERMASFYRRREDNSLQCMDGVANSLWIEPPRQGVLSAGGTVGSIAGGLVSTLDDFARLCLMLQNGGELDGVRVLREDTVRSMCDNLLPEMLGRADGWCLETAGLGFGVLGSVAVRHPETNWYDVPGEYGWGGLAGTAWAVDRRERLVVVSFCQVMYELWIDVEVRKAARKALGYSETQLAASETQPATSETQPSASPQLIIEPIAPLKAEAPGSPSSEASTEAGTPSPKSQGATKRVSEQSDMSSDETPKRQRLAQEEPNPFSLPLPDLPLPVKATESD